MTRALTLVPLLLVAPLALIAGCGQQAPATPESSTATSEATATSDETSEVSAAIDELPEDERALAIAQKVCPVSGEPLGSMGKPIKVTVDGKSLFICCEGCQDPAKEKFAEYYAKFGPQGEAESAGESATN